jgi:predicted transcriptional regulator YdeE/carbon monoxide dehydrogenase subunit G
MRWFLGLIAVVAIVAAALFGVGFFLLPNTLEVTRTTEIARPRVAVFAMINDLKIMKEWSPYYAMDPDADYAFSGEPGPGQTMRWKSNVRQIGEGRFSIVHATDNQGIDGIVEFKGRASLATRITLARANRGTHVEWRVEAVCAAGPINVPCRYMNLVLRGMVTRDLDNGLQRLKTLAEQLPDVDFEGLNPEFVTVEPQSYVYSPVTTSNQNPQELETALNLGVAQVNTFMTQYNLVKSGAQVRVTTGWDQTQNQMSFRVGFPFSGPTPLTVVGVQIGQTPSGSAMKVTHNGPRARIQDTYAQIYAYLQAHRLAPREEGMPWEVVQDEGVDASGLPTAKIEIYVPLQ